MKYNGYEILARAVLHSKDTHPTIIGDAKGELPNWAYCDHCGVSREWLTSYLVSRDGRKMWVADHCLADLLDSEEDAAAVETSFTQLYYWDKGDWPVLVLAPEIKLRILEGKPVDRNERRIVLGFLTGVFRDFHAIETGESVEEVVIACQKFWEGRQANTPPESQHVGTIGNRRIGRLTLERILGPYPGQWADRWGYIFKQGSDTLLWWTTTDVKMEVGDSEDFKYTIKNHTEHNGHKQTEISHAKKIEIPVSN